MPSSLKLECTVWNNGRTGWGIRVLGGAAVRSAHFRPEMSPVIVEIDGVKHLVNVRKKSFWTKCGELIHKGFREWKDRHNLEAGDHVWLYVVEPYHRFRLELR
jgi:hypothetical protein